MRVTIFSLLPALLLLAAACGDEAGPSRSTLDGSAQDAAGDTFTDPNVVVDPDIAKVIAHVEDDTLFLRAEFAPGVVVDSAFIQFGIDIDQNESTGSSNYYANQGSEYLVDLTGYGTAVNLFQYDGNSFLLIASNLVSTAAGVSISAAIPLSALGDDDGHLDFKTAAGSRANAYVSQQLDFAPEETAGPVHVN
jgi:hypothetical protein